MPSPVLRVKRGFGTNNMAAKLDGEAGAQGANGEAQVGHRETAKATAPGRSLHANVGSFAARPSTAASLERLAGGPPEFAAAATSPAATGSAPREGRSKQRRRIETVES
ncbi:hypothetical protein GGTG_10341 [Gaeumannomyces tritici R3-111a-1]|uniref:Uncharacterized protein n=1 Tax=Gaeumannomyces tritici (strain R3-111a-1) TaxID=644352 RepID=J3PA18_GAET3|nr:hypothetical protein GGTG_10341 [Gaeumannomyces tritici R3-111a-1]EJT73504.1 hypothetical protein GGTG_10341 [Gaeumannomyces tritici R3-111a-1]